MTFLQRVEPYIGLLGRVIDLVRPKFYNRLTWAVVVAGLFLMAAPWWSDLVNALAARHLGISLPSADSHFGWGFALVSTGLLYHALVHYIGELVSEQRNAVDLAARREHDRNIFAAFVRLMSEDDLSWILRSLLDDHAYISKQARSLDAAVQHLLAPSTQFLDTQLAQAGTSLGTALHDLADWTSLNFWVVGAGAPGESRYCLFPAGNEDRSDRYPTPEQSKHYDELAKLLGAKVKDVGTKYGTFRATIKRVLAV